MSVSSTATSGLTAYVSESTGTTVLQHMRPTITLVLQQIHQMGHCSTHYHQHDVFCCVSGSGERPGFRNYSGYVLRFPYCLFVFRRPELCGWPDGWAILSIMQVWIWGSRIRRGQKQELEVAGGDGPQTGTCIAEDSGAGKDLYSDNIDGVDGIEYSGLCL